MEVVAMHTPREVVRQDVEAVAGLYRNLGAPVAEQMVMRVLGDLALTMAGAVEMVRNQDLRHLSGQLAHLRRLAEEMGLVSLAKVASDARTCLDRSDGTAFAAVWARLVRVAERSISSTDGAADRSC